MVAVVKIDRLPLDALRVCFEDCKLGRVELDGWLRVLRPPGIDAITSAGRMVLTMWPAWRNSMHVGSVAALKKSWLQQSPAVFV